VKHESSKINALVVFKSGDIVLGGQDQKIRIYDAINYELIDSLRESIAPIYSLALLSNGRIVSGGDYLVKIFKSYYDTGITIGQHDSPVVALEILDNATIVSGSSDGVIKVWTEESGQYKLKTELFHDGLYCFTLLSYGHLLTGGYNVVRQWNGLSFKFNRLFLENVGIIYHSLKQLVNGDIAAAANDGIIYIFQQNGIVIKLVGHTDEVRSLVALPNNYLASVSYDSTCIIWNTLKYEKVQVLQSNIIRPRVIATQPNNNYNLLIGGDSNFIEVWKRKLV
jgi:WD40 repeat protein